jgi:hypothetical protein
MGFEEKVEKALHNALFIAADQTVRRAARLVDGWEADPERQKRRAMKNLKEVSKETRRAKRGKGPLHKDLNRDGGEIGRAATRCRDAGVPTEEWYREIHRGRGRRR